MSYFKTGVFVTEKERGWVETAHKCYGMFLSGGQPMGDPQSTVRSLATQYGLPPAETAFDIKAGEFHVLDTTANRQLVEKIKRGASKGDSPEYVIRVFRDGDKWCALRGEDLMSGCGGFGDTPRLALLALAGDAEAFTVVAGVEEEKP